MKVKYTDKDHADMKELSLKWWDSQPETSEDIFEYAVLQYRLKDFEAAISYLKKLVREEYAASYYIYGDCLYNHSQKEDRQEAIEYYQKFLEETQNQTDAQVLYERAMCYAYGLGTKEDEAMARQLFERAKEAVPEAGYELGCAYAKGKLGLPVDKKLAEQYLRNAYDNYAEEAIFALYELYDRDWKSFPYQRELTEAYSYRIGKYARVIHVNPSILAYQNLADLYLQGFPGDEGEDDDRFRRKANKYLKKIEELKKNAAEG